jgi:hypothetical protein
MSVAWQYFLWTSIPTYTAISGSSPPFFIGWLERGNHIVARDGAFKGSLQKLAHSHTRPLSDLYLFGLISQRELMQTQLETFQLFTHTTTCAYHPNPTSQEPQE